MQNQKNAIVVASGGMLNIEGATIEFDSCSYNGNTKEGQFVGDLYYNNGGNTIVEK